MNDKIKIFIKRHCEICVGHPVNGEQVSGHIYYNIQLKRDSYPELHNLRIEKAIIAYY